MIDTERLSRRLARLRAEFLADLGRRRAVIAAAWGRLSQADGRDDCLQAVHSLAGAAGTFGFDELHRQARALESGLEGLPRGTGPDAELEAAWDRLQALLDRLQAGGAGDR